MVKTINAPKELILPRMLNGDPLEEVEDFTYLGCILTTEPEKTPMLDSIKHVQHSALQPICKSNIYCLRTKLLYGSECWRVIESNMNKVEIFNDSCLRK